MPRMLDSHNIRDRRKISATAMARSRERAQPHGPPAGHRDSSQCDDRGDIQPQGDAAHRPGDPHACPPFESTAHGSDDHQCLNHRGRHDRGHQVRLQVRPPDQERRHQGHIHQHEKREVQPARRGAEIGSHTNATSRLPR